MVVECEVCPLRHSPAFVPMSDDEVRFMRRLKREERAVTAGTLILEEGVESPFLFTVLEGLGLRSKDVPTGGRQVVGFAFPGDFVGLQNGLMGRMGHSFTAVTSMKLCVFHRADLTGLFAEQPERGYDLTWLAASEENFLGEMLASIGRRSALQSMAWLLLRLVLRGRAVGLTTADGPDGAIMPFPYRQRDLADALGLSLVHTNKSFAKLRSETLASWTGGLLRVPHLARLAVAAGTDLDQAIPSPRPLM